MMTEDEAKTKWCPFVLSYMENRHGSTTPPSNRYEVQTESGWKTNESPSSCRCIASDCMAWRWGGFTQDGDDMGYCGLAG